MAMVMVRYARRRRAQMPAMKLSERQALLSDDSSAPQLLPSQI